MSKKIGGISNIIAGLQKQQSSKYVEDNLDMTKLSPIELNIFSKFMQEHNKPAAQSVAAVSHNKTNSEIDNNEEEVSKFKNIMNCNGKREIVVERQKREAKKRQPTHVVKKEPPKVPCDTILLERLVQNIVKRSDS